MMASSLRCIFRIAMSVMTIVIGHRALGCAYPYGVNAHLTRNEFDNHERALAMMEFAGIRHVRIPITYSCVCTNGVCDFSVCDTVFANCRKYGLEPFPVIDCAANSSGEANRLADDPTELVRYMRELFTHYRGQFKTLEFWNEPNIDPFWKDPNAANYVKLLKIVRALQREIDPNLKIALAGMSKIPLGYLRQCYECGLKDAFDVMNVHPYSHPAGPEGWVDVSELRALMAEFGDEEKPIWFTEIGWPTHQPHAYDLDIVKAGLRILRPEKIIRAIYCDFYPEGMIADGRSANFLRQTLPSGGSVEACSPRETVRRLTKGNVDVVFFPFAQVYPADALDAVLAFVKRGGILVLSSNLPLWRAATDLGPVRTMQNGEAIGQCPFGLRSRFSRDGDFPSHVSMCPTKIAQDAGANNRVFIGAKYLWPERFETGDKMVPIVSGADKTGRELVGAAAIRTAAGGGFVVSTVSSGSTRRGVLGSSTESEQAAKIVRALALSFAQGVEAVFTYEFRGWDNYDPWESETHYGLLHANFAPKPAYAAYLTFTSQRPSESINLTVPWHSDDRRTYWPQWRRPDGKVGGILWTIDASNERTLIFGGEVEFYKMSGERLMPKSPSKGQYVLEVSSSPVYFVNHQLIDIR